MADIHPQLLNDCIVLGRSPLCHLLLMNDANYPWFILVPDREHISEVYQLSEPEQQQVLAESSALAESLMNVFTGDKMNIAALGNIVPQFHIHHVVRYTTDIAWPSPIWGKHPAKPYSVSEIEVIVEKLNKSGFEYIKVSE